MGDWSMISENHSHSTAASGYPGKSDQLIVSAKMQRPEWHFHILLQFPAKEAGQYNALAPHGLVVHHQRSGILWSWFQAWVNSGIDLTVFTEGSLSSSTVSFTIKTSSSSRIVSSCFPG